MARRLRDLLPAGGVLRAGATAIMLRVAALGAGLVSTIVLARVLGPAEYGLYAFVFALISILALPVQLGLPTLTIRETARAMAREDWALLRGFWRWAAWLILGTSAVMIGLVLLWLALSAEAMREDRRAAFLWGVPLIPLLALAVTRGAALVGLGRIAAGSFPDQVLRPLLLAGSVLAAVLLWHAAASARLVLQLNAVAALATFLLGAVLLWHARPAGLRQATARRSEPRLWLRALLPLSLISGLQIISQNTDIVMLGLWRSDAEVGVYRIALSSAALTLIGVTALNMVLQPRIAALHAQGETARMQRLVSAGAAASSAVTLLVIAVFVLGGRWLLALLFGEGYGEAFVPLLILSVGTLFTAACGISGTLLVMTGHESQTVKVIIVSTLCNVVLNFALIPAYGTTGAATATLISGALLNILLWRTALRFTGVSSLPFQEEMDG